MNFALPNNHIQVEFNNNKMFVTFNNYADGDFNSLFSLIGEYYDRFAPIKVSVFDISLLHNSKFQLSNSEIDFLDLIFSRMSLYGKELSIIIPSIRASQHQLLINQAQDNGLKTCLCAANMNVALEYINLYDKLHNVA